MIRWLEKYPAHSYLAWTCDTGIRRFSLNRLSDSRPCFPFCLYDKIYSLQCPEGINHLMCALLHEICVRVDYY